MVWLAGVLSRRIANSRATVGFRDKKTNLSLDWEHVINSLPILQLIYGCVIGHIAARQLTFLLAENVRALLRNLGVNGLLPMKRSFE